MSKIRAIETRYAGYRFRSRLEARWAVFFDKMNTAYEYEVEGYQLKDGLYYLPDFILVDKRLHKKIVEIKPNGYPDEEARVKASLLCLQGYDTFDRIIIITGDPVYVFENSSKSQEIVAYSWYFEKHDLEYSEQERDALSKINPNKISAEGVAKFWPLTGFDLCFQLFLNGGRYEEIMNAARAARSARFEFGETGR